MSNPPGWDQKINWLPTDGIANTDLNRMELQDGRIVDWVKQGGEFEVSTVNLPGGEKTGTVYWEKHAQGLVCLRFPELLGTSEIVKDINLKLSPVVAWPDDILVAFAGVYVPFLGIDFAPNPIVLPNNVQPARIEIPYEANTDINIYSLTVHDIIDFQCDNLFCSDIEGNCGIIKQFISYYTTDSVYGTTTAAP